MKTLYKLTTPKGSSLRRMVSRRGVAHVKRNGPGYGFFAMLETRSRIVAVGKTRQHWKKAESDAIAMLNVPSVAQSHDPQS